MILFILLILYYMYFQLLNTNRTPPRMDKTVHINYYHWMFTEYGYIININYKYILVYFMFFFSIVF